MTCSDSLWEGRQENLWLPKVLVFLLEIYQHSHGGVTSEKLLFFLESSNNEELAIETGYCTREDPTFRFLVGLCISYLATFRMEFQRYCWKTPGIVCPQ